MIPELPDLDVDQMASANSELVEPSAPSGLANNTSKDTPEAATEQLATEQLSVASDQRSGDQTGDQNEVSAHYDQFYRLILSNVDGMLVVNDQGIIQLANPAAEALLGKSVSSLVGVPFGFPVMAGEKVEVDIPAAGALPLVAELRTAKIIWEGEPAVLISLRDISDRKAMERSLQTQTDALQSSVDELEAFSYMVSHDLWNHMRRIDQLNEAFFESEQATLSDRGKAQVTQIQDICQQTKATIEGLLQFSRISHMEMMCGSFDIGPLVTELTEQMSLVYGDRTLKLPKQRNNTLYGDKRLLRVVLDNLLENAWKYTANTPNPKVEFGKLSPSRWPKDMPEAAKQPDYTLFFVKDNGIGFSMAHASELFLPFRRLPSASHTAGNGIGLTTVQRIIHRHRGHIWARGQLEKGSTFYFTFPTRKWTQFSH